MKYIRGEVYLIESRNEIIYCLNSIVLFMYKIYRSIYNY